MTDQEIRLKFGEMNAGEMRLARALVAWHEREIANLKAALPERPQAQPILADDGRSLGQVAMQAVFGADTEGFTIDQCYDAAAKAVAAVVLAQAVRRMEAVPQAEMWKVYKDAPHRIAQKALESVRARLIAAAKGEGQVQPVGVNEPPKSEEQPDLSGESEKQDEPAHVHQEPAKPWTPTVGDTVRSIPEMALGGQMYWRDLALQLAKVWWKCHNIGASLQHGDLDKDIAFSIVCERHGGRVFHGGTPENAWHKAEEWLLSPDRENFPAACLTPAQP